MAQDALTRKITTERNRAAKYAENPADAPVKETEALGITGNDNIANYYRQRAETLSWVLEQGKE